MYRLALRSATRRQFCHCLIVRSFHIAPSTFHLFELQIRHQNCPTRFERKAMQGLQPLGPHNLCRNGDCGELVEMCCRFQHYCCGCASGNLGLRAGEPALRITLALRRRRRIVGRVLLCHRARPPPCVVTYIIDHLMNDLGKVSPSRRWACILIRSGVQLE